MAKHAILGPSGAKRWMACPGSAALCKDIPDVTSKDAAHGTAAHALAEMCLRQGTDTVAYQGRLIDGYEVDDEMVEAVQKYVDLVRDVAHGYQIMVEQRLEIAHLTQEDGAAGTADAVILRGDELVVIDLKYGKGVKVELAKDPQLRIYGTAAYDLFSMLGDIKQVRLIICQPRIDHIDEVVMSINELEQFRTEVMNAATRATYWLAVGNPTGDALNPGEDQCRFCRAKATCPALAAHVLSTVADDFVDLNKPIAQQVAPALDRTHDNTVLGNCMQAIDLIETWCKAIRAEVETQLLKGNQVPGYKLVEGRRGARKWANESEVEAALKSFRLKQEQIYDFSLISPTSAEKLAKAGAIGPTQWKKLQDLVTQSEGKPSVAPASDKRPAIQGASVDEFEALT